MRASYQNQYALTPVTRISISDAFDGGNIELVRQYPSSDWGPEHGDTSDGDSCSDGAGGNSNDRSCPGIVVELRIKKDPYSELERTHHFQYFAFRATAIWEHDLPGMENTNEDAANTAAHVYVRFVIVNAGDVSYPQAWEGSTVCYSPQLQEDGNDDDDDHWRRKLETSYHAERGTLSWSHQFGDHGEGDGYSCYFAYFPPYSYRRHLNLVARCAAAAASLSSLRVTSLGQTLDGREIDYVRLGTGPTTAWIIHRQHPGESMAAYYAEGLLTRLLQLDSGAAEDDAVRTSVLEQYTLHIVPCMCPDGAVRGHLRTNACGANLNREWATVQAEYAAPSLARSPEVYHVLRQMERHPPDLFLDIHGDEELPVNFLAGSQGTPPWYAEDGADAGEQRVARLHGAFLAAYVRASPDMQTAIGYTPADDPARRPVINTATKVVAARFDCFASTLEMPFKDCATHPEPTRGWSPRRARRLGAAVLEPLLYIRPHLRATAEALGEFPARDQYVRPQHQTFRYGAKNEVLDL